MEEVSSTHHQQQVMPILALEEVLSGCPKAQQQLQERKPRPQPEQALRCPRCDSINTKFCYYNNYSLSQPRYFCKGCRRYWTQGGSLRNVPVGGGCRKNNRSFSKKASQDQALINTNNNHSLPPPLPLLSYDPSDLSLAFSRHEPFLLGNPNPNHPHIPTPSTGSGFLDILRNGFLHDSTTTTTVLTNPGGFHNFYYGFGSNGKVEEVEEEVVLPFDESLGVSAAEDGGSHGSSYKSMDDGGNKLLMGLQWQLGVDGSRMGVDSSRLLEWNWLLLAWSYQQLSDVEIDRHIV